MRVTVGVNTSRDAFQWVHLGALALAVIMLPWSTAFLSIAQMLLAANWLVEGLVRKDLAGRFKRAFSSGPVLVFLSFLALNGSGLLWTEDMEWGLDLCRILAPVLVFGVILGGSPRLWTDELRTILLLGAWSVVASTFACAFLAPPDADYRALSHFISHIRLALLLAFAVAVFVVYYPQASIMWKGLHIAAAIWSWTFIGKLGSLQASAMLVIILAVLVWREATRWRLRWRVAARATLVLVPTLALGWLAVEITVRYRLPDRTLDAKAEVTAGGERYDHDLTNPQTENGQHVWTYVAWGELARTWERRSQVPFKADDGRGDPLYGTLARYLTSKGLRKDSVAVMNLTDAEVRAIEEGTASLQGQGSRLRARFDEVMMEWERYRAYGDANGHSVTMRLEFLKAGWAIAKDHWLAGVGTGDTRPAFAAQYERMHSTLLPEWRLRAHNEYLTLFISFGVFGLLWSLFSWCWPAWKLGAWRDPLFIAWAILFGFSCLTDDTVETQAGATFFALYYALLVFAAPRKISALNEAPPTRPAPGAARSV